MARKPISSSHAARVMNWTEPSERPSLSLVHAKSGNLLHPSPGNLPGWQSGCQLLACHEPHSREYGGAIIGKRVTKTVRRRGHVLSGAYLRWSRCLRILEAEGLYENPQMESDQLLIATTIAPTKAIRAHINSRSPQRLKRRRPAISFDLPYT